MCVYKSFAVCLALSFTSAGNGCVTNMVLSQIYLSRGKFCPRVHGMKVVLLQKVRKEHMFLQLAPSFVHCNMKDFLKKLCYIWQKKKYNDGISNNRKRQIRAKAKKFVLKSNE